MRKFGDMETWRNVRKGNSEISEFDVRHIHITGVYKKRKCYRSQAKILMRYRAHSAVNIALATGIKTTVDVDCRTCVLRVLASPRSRCSSAEFEMEGNQSRRYGRFYRARCAERRASFLPWNTSHLVCRVVRERNRNTRTRHRAIDTLRAAVKFNVSLVMSIIVFLSDITQPHLCFVPVCLIFNCFKRKLLLTALKFMEKV